MLDRSSNVVNLSCRQSPSVSCSAMDLIVDSIQQSAQSAALSQPLSENAENVSLGGLTSQESFADNRSHDFPPNTYVIQL